MKKTEAQQYLALGIIFYFNAATMNLMSDHKMASVLNRPKEICRLNQLIKVNDQYSLTDVTVTLNAVKPQL